MTVGRGCKESTVRIGPCARSYSYSQSTEEALEGNDCVCPLRIGEEAASKCTTSTCAALSPCNLLTAIAYDERFDPTRGLSADKKIHLDKPQRDTGCALEYTVVETGDAVVRKRRQMLGESTLEIRAMYIPISLEHNLFKEGVKAG